MGIDLIMIGTWSVTLHAWFGKIYTRYYSITAGCDCRSGLHPRFRIIINTMNTNNALYEELSVRIRRTSGIPTVQWVAGNQSIRLFLLREYA